MKSASCSKSRIQLKLTELRVEIERRWKKRKNNERCFFEVEGSEYIDRESQLSVSPIDKRLRGLKQGNKNVLPTDPSAVVVIY